MADGDLTTTDNGIAWLAIANPSPAQATTIGRLITVISTRIQTYLGYQVAAATYTRTFDGTGGAKIMLPDRPVNTVASVSVDGCAIAAAVDARSLGFVFDAKSVALRGARFSRGFQNVTVTYTAGFAQIPGDIEQACLEWMSGVFQSQLRDPSVVKLKAGDSEETYSDGTVAAGVFIPMPASVLGMLQPYRRVSM